MSKQKEKLQILYEKIDTEGNAAAKINEKNKEKKDPKFNHHPEDQSKSQN